MTSGITIPDVTTDLDATKQREILEALTRAESPNYFYRLGLPANATDDAVREAFHEAALRFHPDRFFGRRLGDFKIHIERLFKMLLEANQVLADPVKRAAYLMANPSILREPSGASPAPMASSKSSAVTSQDLDPRSRERRSRLMRHPFMQKAGATREAIGRAREALAQGKIAEALAHAQRAVDADPSNPEAQQALRDAQGAAAHNAT